MLSGCDALVLECNHDPGMLRASSYPQKLRERIAGRHGHLDNGAAAELLAHLDSSRLKHLVAAHLSQENNRPELARAALAAAIGCDPEWVAVADQDNGLGWRSIS
jgi:phosphoribosyl 1,2-cyclic phosphodiesterase